MSEVKKERIKSSKKGVIFDPIDPRLFNTMNVMFCCEQCSHFDEISQSCTIGYDASKHLYKVQMHTYHLNGRMAACRFQEID
jgi:hypothetical protein